MPGDERNKDGRQPCQEQGFRWPANERQEDGLLLVARGQRPSNCANAGWAMEVCESKSFLVRKRGAASGHGRNDVFRVAGCQEDAKTPREECVCGA